MAMRFWMFTFNLGLPLSSLKPIQTLSEKDSANADGNTLSVKKDPAVKGPTAQPKPDMRCSKDGGNGNRLKPNAIVFCRQRMLYARPKLGAKGKIVFGLPNRE